MLESMGHYVNGLKGLRDDCGHDNHLLELRLRDRFAIGLNHTELDLILIDWYL